MPTPKASRNNSHRPRQAQLSLGGLLLVVIIGLVTWWSGGRISLLSITATETPPPQASVVTAQLPATLTPTVAQTNTPTQVPTRRAQPTALPTPDRQPATGQSGLPAVAYDRLPAEAKQAVTLIEQGGPFPFAKDGAIFQNREGLLPAKPRGYYREYTVITPGEDDRGARRIVAGEAGEMYYTADHYDSFQEIVR